VKRIESLLFWITLAVGQVLFVGTQPSAAQPGNPLAGSEWRPVEVRNVSIPEGTTLRVRFTGEGKLAGFAGCNHFFGGYKISNRTLTVSVLGTTRMACGDSITSLETVFLDTLSSTTTFERHRVLLALFDREGAQIAKLAQTDWD
jgi:putative lipoprotein